MCWPPPISSSRRDLWRLPLLPNAAGLVLAWTILGIGMGFGLYEASFATVTGLWGRDARNAITGITLFAGFASTVGWPLSAFFIDAFGWRGACLAWAALHIVIGLPMNRLLVPKAPAPVHEETAAGGGTRFGALDDDRAVGRLCRQLVRGNGDGGASAPLAGSARRNTCGRCRQPPLWSARLRLEHG